MAEYRTMEIRDGPYAPNYDERPPNKKGITRRDHYG
jgi:hypothetical protein